MVVCIDMTTCQVSTGTSVMGRCSYSAADVHIYTTTHSLLTGAHGSQLQSLLGMGGPQQQQLVLVGSARLELTRQERVVRGCKDHQRGTREGKRTQRNMTSQTMFRLSSGGRDYS